MGACSFVSGREKCSVLDDPKKPPLCKGRWLAAGKTEGLYEGEEHIG